MKKNYKAVLSVILSLTMLLGFATVGFIGNTSTKADAAISYQSGDKIKFGMYPQSEVTDDALLSELNSLQLDWVSYDYCSTDKETNTVITSDFMKYADIVYEGSKYRAVTFSYYRPLMTNYELGGTGTRQKYYGYLTDNIYWFKFEPLNWYIIDENEGLLLCEYIVDSQPFASGENNYEVALIREWLNDDFYNTAFSGTQKACIKTARLENGCTVENCSEHESSIITDKVFLLSWDEWRNPEYGMYEDLSYIDENGEMVFEENYNVEMCKAKGTKYANCQGLSNLYKPDFDLEYYHWWLRTTYCGNDSAMGVINSGNGYYMTSPRYAHYGVRPAIKINLYNYFRTNDKYTVEIYTRDNYGNYPETPEKTETVDSRTTPISEYVPEERELYNIRTEIVFTEDVLVLKVYYSSYGWLRWIDGWYGEMEESRQVKQGTYIYDYPYPAREGYCFMGWETNYGEPVEVPFIMPDTDVELWARWEPIEFEVFFDANGGCFSNGEEMLSQQAYFEYYIEPSEIPCRDGYEFIGWSTDPYGEPVDEYDMVLREPYNGYTFYAAWKPMEYTVSYSFVGDVPADAPALPASQIMEYGATVTVADIPSVEGYIFEGWYYNGAITESFVMPAEDVSLVGMWVKDIPEMYNLVLDANGGQFDDGTEMYIEGFAAGEQIFVPVNPQKEGYNFCGWIDENGNEISDIYTYMPEADLYLSAIWEPETDIPYTVITYTMNTGGVYDAVTRNMYGVMDEYAEIPIPEIEEGFVLREDKSELSGLVYPDAVFEIYIDREKYTVNINGETAEYYYGAEIEEPDIPEAEGMIFVGWADTQENEIIFPYIVEARNIEIVPVWKVSEYNVKYIVAGKAFEYKVSYGSEVPVPDVSSLNGIIFRYWKNENGEEVSVPAVMPAKDLVFMAETTVVMVSDEKITATFDEDCFKNGSDMSKVQLVVKDLGKDNSIVSGGEFIIKDENGKSYERIGFYDIKMTYDNNPVEFNEGKTVKIKLPVSGNESVKQFHVVHRFTGGGREEFYIDNPSEKYEDGYVIIEVSKFSEFEVYAETDKEPAATGIKLISAPAKTDYIYKTETVDLSGIAVEITKSDGTKETVTDTSKMKVTGFDNTKAGTQTVTVECEGQTVQFEVTVSYAWWQWIIRILLLGFLWY